MHINRWSLLICLAMLCIMVDKPITKAFAACTALPGIQASPNNLGATTCTIDSGTSNGVDSVSGADNVAVLTLDSSSSHITINAGGHLLVGSINILSSAAGAYISIQPAADPYAAGEIDLNTPAYVVDADTDGYPANLTVIPYNYVRTVSPTPVPNQRRLGLMNTGLLVDCADGNAATNTNKTCYADADNDGYTVASGTSVCSGATCPAGYKDAVTGVIDCNDSYATVWNGAAGSCYLDSDNDGYGSSSSPTYTCFNAATCATATAGSVGTGAVSGSTNFSTVKTDCCDTDLNAFPGQTAFFTTPDACTTPAYDYNCNGAQNLNTAAPFDSATAYACTNPCASCALNYSYTAGWTTAMPATCGATATKTIGTGSYVAGTCYTVASCATLVVTTTPIPRGCN